MADDELHYPAQDRLGVGRETGSMGDNGVNGDTSGEQPSLFDDDQLLPLPTFVKAEPSSGSADPPIDLAKPEDRDALQASECSPERTIPLLQPAPAESPQGGEQEPIAEPVAKYLHARIMPFPLLDTSELVPEVLETAASDPAQDIAQESGADSGAAGRGEAFIDNREDGNAELDVEPEHPSPHASVTIETAAAPQDVTFAPAQGIPADAEGPAWVQQVARLSIPSVPGQVGESKRGLATTASNRSQGTAPVEELNGPASLQSLLQDPLVRIAFYFLLLLILSIAIGIALRPAAGYLSVHLRQQAYVGYLVEMVSALIALRLMMRFSERKTVADAGFKTDGAPAQMLLGFALGAVCVALTVAALFAGGAYQPGHVNPSASLAAPLVISLVIAVTGETIFRGYVLRVAEVRYGRLGGIALSCTLFAMLNYLSYMNLPIPDNQKILGPLCLSLGQELAFSAAYVASRNLWLPIGLHFAATFLIGPVLGFNAVGGAADAGNSLLEGSCHGPFWMSGGSLGPEASGPAVAVFALLALILLIRAYKKEESGEQRHVGAGRIESNLR